jgi:hypothetical protein
MVGIQALDDGMATLTAILTAEDPRPSGAHLTSPRWSGTVSTLNLMVNQGIGRKADREWAPGRRGTGPSSGRLTCRQIRPLIDGLPTAAPATLSG